MHGPVADLTGRVHVYSMLARRLHSTNMGKLPAQIRRRAERGLCRAMADG